MGQGRTRGEPDEIILIPTPGFHKMHPCRSLFFIHFFFFKSRYDWRYGSIRPQDNPSMALYPQVGQGKGNTSANDPLLHATLFAM